MLRENNPDIDFPRLREAVLQVARTRRHELAAAVEARPAGGQAGAGLPPTGWRHRLRRVPGLGPALAHVWRGCKAASAPGLSLRARVRALPVVGGALAWTHALATLPRWRRTLLDELRAVREREQTLQRELDTLRLAQGELLRDFGRLRATAAQAPRPPAPDDGA